MINVLIVSSSLLFLYICKNLSSSPEYFLAALLQSIFSCSFLRPTLFLPVLSSSLFALEIPHPAFTIIMFTLGSLSHSLSPYPSSSTPIHPIFLPLLSLLLFSTRFTVIVGFKMSRHKYFMTSQVGM